ncbi:MAG: LysM peptidoglycan-binding domain-containing protein [Candidatus Pacebacteria bacterium]|nr:LysM peptidoglycan-binding domain-containing protein [Candidatus Paceibacterota bacterium]MDR3583675.1 LysM peptidoglycan-binding domain-containing protein [Candidatus Paceibacterota bacterium]
MKILHLFRGYSALVVVVSSALLVSVTNFAAGFQSGGFLFGYFGVNESTDSPLADKFFLKTAAETDLALAPLAEAKTAPKPGADNSQSGSNDSMLLQGQALVAGTSPVKRDPEEGGGVAIYTVQSGDTVSQIAANHNVTVNTILWANDLDNVDQIAPGDKIFILPVSGLSYTVKSGDDINSIAKKYNAEKDKIIAFNDLPANGELTVGQDILIPGGEKETPKPTPPTGSFGIAQRQYESFGSGSSGTLLSGRGGTGHAFPYGYCTWYVSQRVYVPWSGNAGAWLYNAKSDGYSTGRAPRPGAIMVAAESAYGHVAYVEKVNSNGTFVVSEMNYDAWAKKDLRTVSNSDPFIRGFIYSR